MQLISWLLRETLCGIIITWCTIISVFGQQHPGIIAANDKPQVFLQSGITTPNDESTPSFTRDGKTLYLCNNLKVCISKWENGSWTTPVTAPFSGQFKDWDPSI